MKGRWARRLDVILVVASAVLGLAALAAAALGGGRFELGPIAVSISSPLRPLAQGLALLLLREALGNGSSLVSRVRFLGLLAAFLAALACESPPRLVGDGREYAAMAWNLSEGRPPAPTPEELRRFEARLPVTDPGYSFAPAPPRPDGRRSFYHSWGYSLLAAPFVNLASATGLSLLTAFTVLNGLALLVAAYFVLDRAGPRVALLVAGGAALWWVDKAHPELLLMGVLVTAVATLPQRPGLSLVFQGVAALQYPVFGITILASAVWLARRKRLQEAGVRVGLVVSLLFFSAVPAWNLWWLGRATPLSQTVQLDWPGLAQLTAVLIDPNLGLVFAWPALALALVAGLAVTLRIRPARADTVSLLALVFALLLLTVALPRNLNHGGTRGLSRYALWLVPLGVPLLLALERDDRWSRAALVVLAAGSLVTALTDYHPRREERYVEPSYVAGLLWQHLPAVHNPLPEVFAERTAGFEGRDTLPAATDGCEKALLVGDGTPQAVWPLWCRPRELPLPCRPLGTYCYANKLGSGYSFVRAPRQPAYDGLLPQAWYWTGSPTEGLEQLLSRFTRSTVRRADPTTLPALFAAQRRVGEMRARINPESIIAWFAGPRRRAWVALKPGPRQQAVLVDPRRARVLKHIAVDPVEPTRISLPRRAPLLLVVAPESLLPPSMVRPHQP
jgi:hypothetical protein